MYLLNQLELDHLFMIYLGMIMFELYGGNFNDGVSFFWYYYYSRTITYYFFCLLVDLIYIFKN